MNESESQFSFTRVALSTYWRAEISKFLSLLQSMRKEACLVFAVFVSVSAYGQFRLVDGKPVALREFTAFGQSEVSAITSKGMTCRTFTDQDVVAGPVASFRQNAGQTHKSVTQIERFLPPKRSSAD
ncbi:MAG: hypothetical protein NT154_40215 [Verrucomicrobia bacterium]|nr:hypothetical protein [Verrucomicrobiota bacterium]